MVYFENLKTGYVCEKPETQDAFEDHAFSDFTQSQIINMAFGDNIVTDTDHDIVKVFKGQITWTNAEASCVSHGGHLATIHSESQNDLLWDMIYTPHIE